MFAIGLPPRVDGRRRRPYPSNASCEDTYTWEYFTGQHRSWLLLPQTNYFQRALLNTGQTFTDIYYASLSFESMFPEDSIQYGFARGAFPLYLSYQEIEMSIRYAYRKNMQVRTAMKFLVNLWKAKRMRIVNEVDVVTQEVPKKPVYIHCWATKTIYQYEATTMLRDSVTRLLSNDSLILEPNNPRNPYTNSNLSYASCLSLHQQFRRIGATHWVWEAFASSQFDTYELSKTFEVPMKIECLNLLIKDTHSPFTTEFIMDFILGEFNYHGRCAPSEIAVEKALTYEPRSPCVQEWIDLCKNYWKSQIYFDKRTISNIHARTRKLVSNRHEFDAHLVVLLNFAVSLP